MQAPFSSSCISYSAYFLTVHPYEQQGLKLFLRYPARLEILSVDIGWQQSLSLNQQPAIGQYLVLIRQSAQSWERDISMWLPCLKSRFWYHSCTFWRSCKKHHNSEMNCLQTSTFFCKNLHVIHRQIVSSMQRVVQGGSQICIHKNHYMRTKT